MKSKKIKKIATVIFLSATLFTLGCAQSNPPESSPTPSPKVMSWSKPPSMQIDTGKTYSATIDTTLGSFKIQLYAQESPNTVNNFVFLARQGFYNGIIFHRIMKTFMIQTGDPNGDGTGDPGYEFEDELPPKHSYDPGIVAMANRGPDTQGSQFFVCTGADAARSLNSNPNYTQFGKVTEGMDIVQKIASVPVGPNPYNPREMSKPNDPPYIKSITITEQ